MPTQHSKCTPGQRWRFGVSNKPLRKAERVASFARFIGRVYAAAISRVALIGSFNTLQSALKFASRGRT
jgi:hypothetical protein